MKSFQASLLVLFISMFSTSSALAECVSVGGQTICGDPVAAPETSTAPCRWPYRSVWTGRGTVCERVAEPPVVVQQPVYVQPQAVFVPPLFWWMGVNNGWGGGFGWGGGHHGGGHHNNGGHHGGGHHGGGGGRGGGHH